MAMNHGACGKFPFGAESQARPVLVIAKACHYILFPERRRPLATLIFDTIITNIIIL